MTLAVERDVKQQINLNLNPHGLIKRETFFNIKLDALCCSQNLDTQSGFLAKKMVNHNLYIVVIQWNKMPE